MKIAIDSDCKDKNEREELFVAEQDSVLARD